MKIVTILHGATVLFLCVLIINKDLHPNIYLFTVPFFHFTFQLQNQRLQTGFSWWFQARRYFHPSAVQNTLLMHPWYHLLWTIDSKEMCVCQYMDAWPDRLICEPSASFIWGGIRVFLSSTDNFPVMVLHKMKKRKDKRETWLLVINFSKCNSRSRLLRFSSHSDIPCPDWSSRKTVSD